MQVWIHFAFQWPGTCSWKNTQGSCGLFRWDRKNNLLVIIGFFFLNGDTIKDWKIMHCSKTVLSSNPVHAIGCSSCWMVDRFYSRHWGRGDGAVTATLTSAQCRIGHPCRQAAVPLHKYTFTYISCSDCIFNGSLEVFVFLQGTRLYCTFYPA